MADNLNVEPVVQKPQNICILDSGVLGPGATRLSSNFNMHSSHDMPMLDSDVLGPGATKSSSDFTMGSC